MKVPFSYNKQNIPAELPKIAEFANSVDLCRRFLALKEFAFYCSSLSSMVKFHFLYFSGQVDEKGNGDFA